MEINYGASATAACEVLVFGLGTEEYAISIQQVQELRGYTTVTQIANAPDYLKGVINLRGVIVPIIDMRIKLGNATPTYDATTVVVVLNLSDTVTGIVVDRVSDVLSLSDAQMKPAPQMTSAINAGHIRGIGTLGERMLIVVDIDKLMSGTDINLIEK